MTMASFDDAFKAHRVSIDFVVLSFFVFLSYSYF